MEESILNFAKQFDYQPQIKNSEKLKNKYQNFVVGGMGGSALSAEILKIANPAVNLCVYRDYGLPKYDENFCQQSLFIASSYSGNTEETLDFADEAYSKGYDIAIIATGGKLIDFAIKNNLPYIEIPDTKIQPRVAIGFSTLALSSIIAPNLLPELQSLAKIIDPKSLQKEGRELAKVLQNKIPVIYTSNQNRAVAYNWKIKLNETAKIPAFCNSFPELNHNEMQGFDFVDFNKKLSENFHFIFIVDADDNARIIKRTEVLEELLQTKGLPVNRIYFNGATKIEKIFNSLILADWVSLELAKKYETEPEEVPLIEAFKKKII